MLHLERLGRHNWREAVFITTDPARRCPLDEEWVTSSAFSIVQSVFEPEWDCRLILDDARAVGFVFYGLWPRKGAPLLCRYVIDVAEQGKGYGQRALPLVIDELRRQYGGDTIYLTLEAANRRAVHIYEKFGFTATGERDEGEDIYVYRAPPRA